MALIRLTAAPARGTPQLVVLRALGLGDLLAAVPALRALHRAFGDYERILAAPAALTPLVRLLDGAVDAIADADFRGEVGSLPAALGPVAVAVNLHGRGPQSHRALLETRPGRLIAWAHDDVPGAIDGAAWRRDEHERVRWCRLLSAYGITADPDDLHLPPPTGDVAADAPGGAVHRDPDLAGVTVVHPGAAAIARRWPTERWAAVARHERSHGRRVVITGGSDEIDLAKAVAQDAGLGGEDVVAGRTDLADLADLVAMAGRVVCGDTGVAHLASAFATPSVVLFGPTDPAAWGPPATGPHTVLWDGAIGDPHATTTDDGLLRITVDAVTVALDQLPPRPIHVPPARTSPTGTRRGVRSSP